MKGHGMDAVALVFGLLAIASAGAWFTWDQELLTAGQLALAAPITLIGLGVVGVGISLLRNVPRQDTDHAGDTGTAIDTDTDKET